MRWIDLPVIDHLDKAYFLSRYKTRAYIDTKIPSLEKLMRNLPSVKENKILKKRIAMGKDKNKGLSFYRSKV